jgi:hypothetical protein
LRGRGDPVRGGDRVDESSGDPKVDGALARLGELDLAPLSGHPEIFEDVHRRLQEALAGTDEAPAQGEP